MGELSLMTANGLEISSFISSTWPGMEITTEKAA